MSFWRWWLDRFRRSRRPGRAHTAELHEAAIRAVRRTAHGRRLWMPSMQEDDVGAPSASWLLYEKRGTP